MIIQTTKENRKEFLRAFPIKGLEYPEFVESLTTFLEKNDKQLFMDLEYVLNKKLI